MSKPLPKKILHALLGAASAALFIGAMYYAIMVYAVRKVILADMTHFDGLGRKLEYPPKLVRVFITDGAMWPGLSNSLLDLIIFWGALITAYFLARPIFKD
jgi:hypothetical protein